MQSGRKWVSLVTWRIYFEKEWEFVFPYAWTKVFIRARRCFFGEELSFCRIAQESSSLFWFCSWQSQPKGCDSLSWNRSRAYRGWLSSGILGCRGYWRLRWRNRDCRIFGWVILIQSYLVLSRRVFHKRRRQDGLYSLASGPFCNTDRGHAVGEFVD